MLFRHNKITDVLILRDTSFCRIAFNFCDDNSESVSTRNIKHSLVTEELNNHRREAFSTVTKS